MRLRLIGLLAALVLIASQSPLSPVKGVEASEHARLFAPFRSTLKNLHGFFSANSGEDHNVDTDSAPNEGQGGSLREQTYRMFMMLYNKTYRPNELRRRMALFFKRHNEIERSAKEFAEGRSTFAMRENSFTDWDESELKTLTGVAPPKGLSELVPEERKALATALSKKQLKRRRRSIENDEFEIEADDSDLNFSNETWYDFFGPDDDDDDDDEINDQHNLDRNDDDDPGLNVMATENIPASKDWRLSNCIKAPINQRNCGCCYAIATMNTIESVRCLKVGSSPTLSPQHIVDCTGLRSGYRNKGCQGGWPTRVLNYLRDTGVAVKDRCYPYVRRENVCRLRQVAAQPDCTLKASPTNSDQLRFKVLSNERDILHHVANTGPVITVMEATQKFLFYSRGIFDDPSCSRYRDAVDHAIVIVGYGQENGIDYWLIKNSWGVEWGENGFGKYRRGRNACSIGYWGWVILS